MKNPNAAVGVGSSLGGGMIVSLIFRAFGVELEPEAAIGIAGAFTGVALWIGREGVRGIGRRIWRGSKPDPAK